MAEKTAPILSMLVIKITMDPSMYTMTMKGTIFSVTAAMRLRPPTTTRPTMTMMKMPVTQVGMPKDESILPEMALTWVMLPMPKEAMRQNKENSVARTLPIHLQPFRLPRPSLR